MVTDHWKSNILNRLTSWETNCNFRSVGNDELFSSDEKINMLVSQHITLEDGEWYNPSLQLYPSEEQKIHYNEICIFLHYHGK